MLEKDWTFWLMMTNYALALITAAALLLVAGAVGWEIVTKRALRARNIGSVEAEWQAMQHAGAHGLSVPGLGFTMADGGEKIESPESDEKDSGQE
ncbi:MAG TPA: hypothetical protein VKV39_11040 [Candidatus Sulfotelmatobacter sp.]|nr:hypothetical protein [Candidatus Sulfotelmatobacter sp.]